MAKKNTWKKTLKKEFNGLGKSVRREAVDWVGAAFSVLFSLASPKRRRRRR